MTQPPTVRHNALPWRIIWIPRQPVIMMNSVISGDVTCSDCFVVSDLGSKPRSNQEMFDDTTGVIEGQTTRWLKEQQKDLHNTTPV